MVEQTVENIRGFVRCSRDDLDVIRAVLVGHMGVEAEAGVDAVAASVHYWDTDIR